MWLKTRIHEHFKQQEMASILLQLITRITQSLKGREMAACFENRPNIKVSYYLTLLA